MTKTTHAETIALSPPQEFPPALKAIVKRQDSVINKSRFINKELTDLIEKINELNNPVFDSVINDLVKVNGEYETLCNALYKALGEQYRQHI